jgi:tetratricopeptide (TPR) repeat protein
MVKKAIITAIILVFIVLHPVSASCSKRDTVETIMSKIKEVENLRYKEIKEALNILLLDVAKVKSEELSDDVCSVANVLMLISNDFQTIEDLTNTGSLENHKKALEIAQRIERNVDYLWKKSQNKLLAELPEFSLKTFYGEEAKFFENFAVNEKVTVEKIELLSLSRQCYLKCNDLKSYARIDFELKRITSVYERDMNTARDLYEKAKRDYEEALRSDVIHGYMKLKDALGLIENSYILYKKHGKVPEEVESLKASIESKQKELSKDFMVNIAIYCVVLFSVMFVLLRRLKTWMKDVEDTRLGRELSEY